MTFGERLRKLREEKEVTQSQIGELIGVSSRMISYYESNRNIPRDSEAIIKLAKYFDVSLDYLFGVSNIRTYDEMLKSFNSYNSLPEKGQKEADEYIRFLKQKYKVK